MSYTNLDAAGMTDFETGRLRVARFPFGPLARPTEITVEGDCLYYAGEARAVNPVGMLDAFRRIRNGAGVLRFARRYGVLGFCEHGEPYPHHPNLPCPHGEVYGHQSVDGQLCLPQSRAIVECLPGWDGERWSEPVNLWLAEARRVAGVLKAAASLKLGEVPGDSETRAILLGWKYADPDDLLLQQTAAELNAWEAKRHLELVLDRMLRSARVGFDWNSAGPAVAVGGTVHSTLGLQMSLLIIGQRELASCTTCGAIYTRERRATKKGQANYCPDCKASGADARYRKHLQLAKRKLRDR